MIAYVTYTPDVAFRGVDEFTVRMTDGRHVLDRTFKVDVVEPDPVVEEEPADQQPAAEVRSDPPVVTAPPATVVVGKAVKPASSPLEQRIAKACGKLKGTRKATCVKRERAGAGPVPRDEDRHAQAAGGQGHLRQEGEPDRGDEAAAPLGVDFVRGPAAAGARTRRR